MCRVSQPGADPRAVPDACPGVSRPFVAADGGVVRLRTAGRPVAVAALSRLLDLVAAQSDPALQLTSRGSVQLRGLPDPITPATVTALVATGLVPSPSHELVRNVVASPLTGLDAAGLADLRPLVRDLDTRLCADADLARLPGRFLFALDDGRGDVMGEAFDLGLLATGRDRCVVVAADHRSTAGAPPPAHRASAGDEGLRVIRGWTVPLADAAATLVRLAHAFVVAREATQPRPWHVRELAEPLGPPPEAEVEVPPRPRRPVGAVGRHAVVGVPLGLLTREHVDALAQHTDEVLVTPWRSLVVTDGAAALPRLTASGLVTSPSSPWLRLHACTGAPGCAKSAIDTRRLAQALAPRLPTGPLPVQVSGCERRCGAPATPFLDLLAPPSVDAALHHLLSEER